MLRFFILMVFFIHSPLSMAIVIEYQWKPSTTDKSETYKIEFFSDREFKNLLFVEVQSQKKIKFNLRDDAYVRLSYSPRENVSYEMKSQFKLSYNKDSIRLERIAGEQLTIREIPLKKKRPYVIKAFENLNAFYAISAGEYKEEGNSGNTSKVSQNSLLTLGVMKNDDLSSKTSLSHSLYLSHLLLEYDKKKKNSLEIGVNSYLNLSKNHYTFYTGFDLERLPFINTDLLSIQNQFEIKNQTFLYATLGLGHNFSFLGKKILTKASLSPTLYAFNEMNNKKYSGYKMILFSSLTLSKKWGLQVFIKRHSFKNAGTLNLTRFGIGANYHF